MSLRLALCGSRFFGASVFEALRHEPGVRITCVVAPEANDRLAVAARAAGVPLHVLDNPRLVPGEALAEGCDLLVAAHTHARVSDEALAQSRLGGVGYHPSLLPRHRGIAAVEWTILSGDPIAGGSVYHLADGWDAGPIAAQDWCFVARGDTARSLWERELAPMGLRLLQQVVRHARDHGTLPAKAQDPAHATRAPMLRRAVTVSEAGPPAGASVVMTVVGPDRPGIVSRLADRAQRFGANWTESFMANLGGEFAGIVQLEVPSANRQALCDAMKDIDTPEGLRVMVASRDGAAATPRRGVAIELAGEDRPGLLSELAQLLASRQVSIEHLHTECTDDRPGAARTFKVRARLLVPAALSLEDLRSELGALAQRLLVDIALG